jgi:glycosyltransferase involved in cell wall biosynthesis
MRLAVVVLFGFPLEGRMVSMRILHAPADVAGNAYGLSRAERELGLESDVAIFTPSGLGYGYDFDLHTGLDVPIWRRLQRRAAFLRRAVHTYDIFHFNFGQTILGIRQFGLVLDELAWLRRRGKMILFTYQGSDVRPADHCPCGSDECRRADRYRRPAAGRALRLADRIFYQNPDLRQWLPGARFMPYASVDAREFQPVPLPNGQELIVAHAPTDRNVKGTSHVIEAVDKLRKEGVPLRLDLIEGVTREETLERISSADILIDQLLLGWYGTVATEAMAVGRPVMAYIREDEPEDNPFGSRLPIVRTSPRTLVGDLRALAADGPGRFELAKAGPAFVQEAHDPRRIAREALEGLVEVHVPPGRSASAATAH